MSCSQRIDKALASVNGINPGREARRRRGSTTSSSCFRAQRDGIQGAHLSPRHSPCRISISMSPTAYDILRHNGLEIGKRDFMGRT